jgi:hypothetical protein
MAIEEPYLAPVFSAHARALGVMCVVWGHLEAQVNLLLGMLLDLNEQKLTETVTHNLDMRDKLQIVLGLEYLKVQNDAWFTILKWAIERIDNDLRPRRNRMVHDIWTTSAAGDVKKVETRTGLRKPQAFQLEYFTKIETPMTVDEINLLGHDISLMGIRLFALALSCKPQGAKLRDALPELLVDSAPLPPNLIKSIESLMERSHGAPQQSHPASQA